MPLASEARHQGRRKVERAESHDDPGSHAFEDNLVLHQQRADRRGAETEQDENRREACDEQQAGPDDATHTGPAELRGRDADDR